MTDSDYAPPSPFLKTLIEEERDIDADAIPQLIALTQDEDPANRDWALLLLSDSEDDSPEVLAALVAGMDDTHHEAALEAVIGVAMRDPALALPRVAALLEGESIDSMTLEAAAWIADPSLLPALNAIAEEVDADGDEEDERFAEMLDEAIAACTRGTPPEGE